MALENLIQMIEQNNKKTPRKALKRGVFMGEKITKGAFEILRKIASFVRLCFPLADRTFSMII